jgi:hypothetical protein
MKTTALIIGLLGLGMGVNAQSIMDKLYDKYSGTEGYTSVYISKYMFDMFRSDETGAGSKEDEMEKLLSKLNGIKILVTDDDPATPIPVDLYKEIMKVLPSSQYKEVMVVKEKDQDIKFYAKEENNKVTELLLVMGGKAECALISIQGDIDMKNISKLAKSMNIEGMENLEKMKEK